MISRWKAAAACSVGLLTATAAVTARAERVSTTASRAYVEVTISQNYGNMPVEGPFWAMNQYCQIWLYVRKDGVVQDVWNDWDVYWSSNMGDQIHEYPHNYVTGYQVGAEQMHVLVRDKRDGSVGTATAQLYVYEPAQVYCY